MELSIDATRGGVRFFVSRQNETDQTFSQTFEIMFRKRVLFIFYNTKKDGGGGTDEEAVHVRVLPGPYAPPVLLHGGHQRRRDTRTDSRRHSRDGLHVALPRTHLLFIIYYLLFIIYYLLFITALVPIFQN
jgi:hypothetical protein